MELLLNLVWLLLAFPAYRLWRSHRTTQKSSMQCLLALACLLVLLFPVISATDDLQTMRTEMEESSGTKRTLRQAANPDDSPLSGWHSPAAVAPTAATPPADREHQLMAAIDFVVLPFPPTPDHSGRAPPSTCFLAYS